MDDQTKSGLLAGYLTEPELATEVRRSTRTLKRWRRLRIGPPFVFLGREPIYPIAGARDWLRSGEIKPRRGSRSK